MSTNRQPIGDTNTNGETPHPLYSLTILAYRKAGMDEAEYHEYMTEKHAASVKDLMVEKGIFSYTMQHNTTATTHPFMTQIFGTYYTNNIADHDCIIQIVFRDPADFCAVKDDPHYQAVVLPDHGRFADTKRTIMVTGWFEEHVSRGKLM